MIRRNVYSGETRMDQEKDPLTSQEALAIWEYIEKNCYPEGEEWIGAGKTNKQDEHATARREFGIQQKSEGIPCQKSMVRYLRGAWPFAKSRH